MWTIKDMYSNGNIIPFEVWKSRGAQDVDYLLWRGIVSSVTKIEGLFDDSDVENDGCVRCGIICESTFTLC